ncbi:hypothetical protein Pint_11616 [Pistacia integerrima]|uniref:Uncharacterized protein n=1 Tax=Pistacia integerrima TaxID=434235 RepID=A0ACC0XEK8_9ROSI|nr:hypothetical protein Pint_11616 [Pistacia integerrima]
MAEVIFSKVLSTTDTKNRLALPMEAFHHFFPEEEHVKCVQFMVMDSDQKQYEFRLATRNKGKHPKPAITGDWLNFVANKGLKVRDKVILYQQQNEAGRVKYTIEVKKGIIIFGKYVREA